MAKRTLGAVLAVAVHLCLAPPARPDEPPALPEWVELEANVPYDRFDATVLDVMWPKSEVKAPRPGVIMFHGGGWIGGSRTTMIDTFALPYLKQGFVVCNVGYRVAAQATAPAAVADALRAARWFFDHAGKYDVDTSRVVVTGASAGGHLALMVGMTPASAGLGPAVKMAAVVNVFGITDVADLLAGEHQRSWAMRWIPPQEGRADLARRLSPLTYVRPDLPPILTLHGDMDATVPTEQASRLTRALRAEGVDAELIVVPGAGHGFSRGQWSLLHEQIFAFLRRHARRGGCQMGSGRTMWSIPLEQAVPIALMRSACEPR